MITGTQWEGRGARMDEMIAILRGLCDRRATSSSTASYYDIPAIKLCPVPTKPMPILIGGHADAALRRAARLSDGWMHGGGKENLADLLAKLRALPARGRHARRSPSRST